MCSDELACDSMLKRFRKMIDELVLPHHDGLGRLSQQNNEPLGRVVHKHGFDAHLFCVDFLLVNEIAE